MTTAQIRQVAERLIAAGQWQPSDPDILVVLDAGYDAPRIAHLLADLPVEILGRMRSDRVLCRPVPPRVPGATPPAALTRAETSTVGPVRSTCSTTTPARCGSSTSSY